MKVKAARISENFTMLLDFLNFCLNIYGMVACKEENCEYKIYSGLLNDFLLRFGKCFQEERTFFMTHY